MIDTNKLLSLIEAKSEEFKAEIAALKKEGKSTASKQCMKTYTDFDVLVLKGILGDEDAKSSLIKRLDAKYNKIVWVAISKQEYIKLLSDEKFEEENLKMEKGAFYRRG